MPIQNKPTGDSNLPAAQQKQGTGITDKIGGAVNVIHGTGEVIRGHALEAGDFGRHGNGDGKAIIAAGREEVQRGLDRIEGKITATSAAGNAPDRNRNGAGDGAGTAPNPDSTAPQASTVTARTDPTDEKVRGDAADTKRPAEWGTAGAAANGGYGRTPQEYRDDPTATAAAYRDRPTAADDPGVQRDTDLRQRGDRTVPGDYNEGTDATRATADASYPTNAAGQEQHSVKAPTAAYRDRPNEAYDPNIQRETDLRQQENRAVPGNFDEGAAATRTTADALSRDRPTEADDPNIRRDADLRLQGNRTAPGNFDEGNAPTRATADASYPTNTTGQEQPPDSASVPPQAY